MQAFWPGGANRLQGHVLFQYAYTTEFTSVLGASVRFFVDRFERCFMGLQKLLKELLKNCFEAVQ